MCVPYTGSQAWTSSLGYKTLDEWRPWTSNDQVAGYLQGYDHNLTFLTIKVIISVNNLLLKNGIICLRLIIVLILSLFIK